MPLKESMILPLNRAPHVAGHPAHASHFNAEERTKSKRYKKRFQPDFVKHFRLLPNRALNHDAWAGSPCYAHLPPPRQARKHVIKPVAKSWGRSAIHCSIASGLK